MQWEPAALRRRVEDIVWRPPAEGLPRVLEWLLRIARMVIVLARDLAQDQLSLRAMGLVYTTLLSLVPLLALSFSVLKAFGVYNQLQPVLLGFLEPLGAKGAEVTTHIMRFIEHMNVGVLGSVGLALLLYTAISLVQKIEEAFNFIWQVSQTRSLGERFSRYLSALLVGPLLVFAAMGITATVAHLDAVHHAMTLPVLGWLAAQAGQLVPYLLVIGAFTFIYAFMPNTKVRFGAALAGGVVGGVLWQTAGWGFALFTASSTSYSAIYSSFAVVILFMLWLYLSWMILLIGASVAFYAQHPENLVAKGGESRLSIRKRERLALETMSLIAHRHMVGSAPWSADALAQALRLPTHAIDATLAALQARGLLAPTSNDPPGWLPQRDLATVSAGDLIDAVRSAHESQFLSVRTPPGPEAVERLLQRYDDATRKVLGEVSAKDLAATPSEAPEKRA